MLGISRLLVKLAGGVELMPVPASSRKVYAF
jgi:hypothetical protein